MKIAYFVTHFPYDKSFSQYYCGGLEVVASNLAINMLKKDHILSIFTTSIDNHDLFEKHGNMTIYRYSKNFKIAQANMSFKLLFKPMEHETDIVHTHAGNPPAPIAALRYAQKKRKPFIVTYHGDLADSSGDLIRRVSVYFYKKYLLDRILRHADIIISPSRYSIKNSAFLRKYSQKVVVIPNGINLADFKLPHSKEDCRRELGLKINDNIILFVGALSTYKGPDVLVKAMPRIIENIPNARLIFVGDGVLRKELEKKTRELGIDEKVKFEGYVEDIYRKALFYKSSDVFVLPSTQEQDIFGIVNLEAMACGVPIVASRIGGIPDVVSDGENGLLVTPNNTEALAQAVARLLLDDDLRSRMSEEGNRRVQNFSWETIADQTEKLYIRLAT